MVLISPSYPSGFWMTWLYLKIMLILKKNSYLPPLNIVKRICHQDWMPRYFWNWNKTSTEWWLWNNLRGISSSYMTDWQDIATWPSTMALTPVNWARFSALVLLWPALTLFLDGGYPVGLTSGVLFVITWPGSGQILGFCIVTWRSHQNTCMYFHTEKCWVVTPKQPRTVVGRDKEKAGLWKI